MHKIIYSPQSNQDLIEIYTFIATDNLFYASKVIEKIKYSINFLKEYPSLGKKVDDNNLREIVEPRYGFRIVYQIS